MIGVCVLALMALACMCLSVEREDSGHEGVSCFAAILALVLIAPAFWASCVSAYQTLYPDPPLCEGAVLVCPADIIPKEETPS